MLWLWLYLVLLAAVAGLWAWINLSSTYRSSLQYVLHPWNESADDQHNRLPLTSISETAQRFEAPGDSSAPAVAILCPGRNEASHLPETLPELCEQDYPAYRVVFVDDASEDATPQITEQCTQRYAHLSVLRNGQAPPTGWVGKCWALHRGYEHLQSLEQRDERSRPAEWLCFTDADIHWDPRCLRSAIAMAECTDADVVALAPKLVFGSGIEAVVQLQLMLAIGLMLPIEKATDPDHPDTLTGGAFILVRRSLYDRIGGHEAVRDRVVDDLNLGRKLKAAGGRIRVALAPHLQWARMYEGWADMWEGLTKNAYAGLEYRLDAVVAISALVFTANILPPIYLLLAIIACIFAPSALTIALVALAALTVLLSARVMNGVRKLAELPARYAWTLPVGSALYLVLLLASVWRYYRGGNVWKGRAYNRAALEETAQTDAS